MWTRREFLERTATAGAAVWAGPLACAQIPFRDGPVFVNDVHSRLNRTAVERVVEPRSLFEVQTAIRGARAAGDALSLCGSRHAMGGQQFGTGTVLIDLRGLDRVVELDTERGEVEAEAGIEWPELLAELHARQQGEPQPWSIVQKQTGADRITLGGTLAANGHGRGLTRPPIVSDVEAFTLVDARGELFRCSRRENPDLFRLAIGGYGLFGVIASVRLRLARRRKLERVVEVIGTEGLAARFEERIAEGYLFGDFQYSTDGEGSSLLREGVFSCYRPVADDMPVTPDPRRLDEQDWLELIVLAHHDRKRAFELYTEHYLATSGQVYWSDTHQLSTYVPDYHTRLREVLGEQARGSEMITELYVPRGSLFPFLEDLRGDLRENRVPLVYGTIRLIEPDTESFLPWARSREACVILNLHTQHDSASLRRTRVAFQRLIDHALRYGGRYFLTYHRWARRDQILAGYPEFPEFLRRKLELDPEERFQSDWYRHHRALFADLL